MSANFFNNSNFEAGIMNTFLWILFFFAAAGLISAFCISFFHSKLRKLCLSFEKGEFFLLKRKIPGLNGYAEGFISINFLHKDFPDDHRNEIRTLKNIVDICIILFLGLSVCIWFTLLSGWLLLE